MIAERVARACVVGTIAFLAACAIVTKEEPTIRACASDSDCSTSSSHCLAGYCDAEECSKVECPSGWRCDAYSYSGLFTSGSGKRCNLPCIAQEGGVGGGGIQFRGSCPESYACIGGICHWEPGAASGSPTIAVTPEMTQAKAGDPVTFRAAVTSPNGPPKQLYWDFGDTSEDVVGTATEVSHAYTSDRTAYSGQVTLIDPRDLEVTARFDVTMCVGTGSSCSPNTNPGCCAPLTCESNQCR